MGATVLGLEVGTEEGGWVKPVGAASGVVLGPAVEGAEVVGAELTGVEFVGR